MKATVQTPLGSGAKLPLDVGDEVQINLRGNLTTGFRWELVTYDPAIMELRDQADYEPDHPGLAGVGDSWTWALAGVGPGECSVEFAYHRPWENRRPAKMFVFVAAVDLAHE